MNTEENGRRRAVVFDLDGTLVDSLPDLTSAVNRLLAGLGRESVAEESVRLWVGDGVTALVNRAVEASGGYPEGFDQAEAVAAFRRAYQGHAAVASRLYPHVQDVLDALAADGFILGVCTNKPAQETDEVLDGMGIAALFDAVIGGDSLPVRKPDPEHLLATLRALCVDPADAVMVGDSVNDVMVARNAGVASVAVSFGYSRIDAALLGADVVIDDFAELPGHLARLLAR